MSLKVDVEEEEDECGQREKKQKAVTVTVLAIFSSHVSTALVMITDQYHLVLGRCSLSKPLATIILCPATVLVMTTGHCNLKKINLKES